MQTVCLRDGCFPQQFSATLADQASGERPTLMQWQRIAPGEGAGQTVVFTDFCIAEAVDSPAARKVAWLIEPPAINRASYEKVRILRSHFDAVLTHQHEHCEIIDALLYPFGGTRITAQQRHIARKSKDVCIIASHKRMAVGHKLRHDVIDRFQSLDVYGDGYNQKVAHGDVLPKYRYAVVVENEQSDYWFTEKLIDCLLVGTIPLYWGTPAIHAFFDTRSIWKWSYIDDLASLLHNATPKFYSDLFNSVSVNALSAQQYICAEDWITRAYPGIWENK